MSANAWTSLGGLKTLTHDTWSPHNSRAQQVRRELQTTLTERRAFVDSLLEMRAGRKRRKQVPLPVESDPAPMSTGQERASLKRYYNE